MRCSISVVLFLLIDVIDHPFQIFRAERNDAVSALPLESLRRDLVIDVMRAGAFQFPDPIRNENIWLKADGDVDVCFDSADRVKPSAGSFEDFVRQVAVKPVFNAVRDHRKAVFCVPGYMEIDLGINAVRHSGRCC